MIELNVFATPRHVVYWNLITKTDGDDHFFGALHVEDHDVLSALLIGVKRGTMNDGESWVSYAPMVGRNDAHGESVDYRLVSDEGASVCLFERAADDLKSAKIPDWLITKALAEEGQIYKKVWRYRALGREDLPVDFVNTLAWKRLQEEAT